MILPPGTILQHLYLEERLGQLTPGSFVEVGVGRGDLSRLLVDAGWIGVGYDLNEAALHAAADFLYDAIHAGRYRLRHADWLAEEPEGKHDLIISSMVLEHLDDQEEAIYFGRCSHQLTTQGRAIFFVPGSPHAWGIEDDIAGHRRRYTMAGLEHRLHKLGWKVQHIAGLTYPLSNVLLPLSNFLVARYEGSRSRLGSRERTVLSGKRHVPFKTSFPAALELVLNRWTLYPFHLWQKAHLRNERALVIYVECQPSDAE